MDSSVVDLELHRLRSGTFSPQQQSFPFLASIKFDAESPELIQERLTTLLSTVFRFLLLNPIDYENEPGPFVINREYWHKTLPEWFLQVTPFESESVDDKGWTVEAWLYWFLSPTEVRAWIFYDLQCDGSQVVLRVEIEDDPFLWGALKWTILAAGANPDSIDVT